MKILGGKGIAKDIIRSLKRRALALSRKPTLAAISVDPRGPSRSYVLRKEQSAREAGMRFVHCELSARTGRERLQAEMRRIARRNYDGVILQLPLPGALDRDRPRFLDGIPEDLDVDCLSERWRGRLETGNISLKLNGSAIKRVPPIVNAVFALIHAAHASLRGAHVMLIGWGDLVGKPLLPFLLREGATVTICRRKTRNLAQKLRTGDIIISGAGSPRLLRGSMIKRGATLIDCGASTCGGKLVGDIDATSVAKRARWLSPVPGGVGPLTVAFVLKNTLDAAEAKTRKK